MIVYNSIQNDARVIRAAEALSKDNKEITVISCNSDKQYENLYFKSIVYHSSKKGPLLLISFWRYILFYLIRHKNEFDILYLHDYFLPIIGKIYSIFSKKKWVYDAHELLIQRKSFKLGKRDKVFQYLEKLSINKADLVIAANEERCRIVKSIYKLHNCISVTNISDINISLYSNSTEPKNIIVYQGILNSERRVDLFIKVLKFLPPYVLLKLIGGGDIEYYRNMAKQLGVEERVIFTGRLPYAELMKETIECKIGFVTYRMDDLNNIYCSPNKLYEYIQAGLPIIVTPQPFLVDVVKKYGIGEVWDNRDENIKNLAEKIEKIINYYTDYKKKMSIFNTDYNNANEMQKLVAAINNL